MASYAQTYDHFMQFLDEGGEPADIWPSFAQSLWKQDIETFEVLGYIGHWKFYKADGTDNDHLSRSFRCLRSYTSQAGADIDEAVILRNFHEQEPGLYRANKREQDGLYESTHVRSIRDPYFSCCMKLNSEEVLKGLPSSMFWRVIPLTKNGAAQVNTACRMPPALPPDPLDVLGEEASSQYPNWAPLGNSGSTVWAFEGFITDDKNRWSLGPLYSVQSLRLISHFAIREYEKRINPERAIQFRDEDIAEERPRLPQDPAEWLDPNWKGVMVEMLWDDDGLMSALRPRPVSWTAPDAKATTHKLFLYPDGMYAYYPVRIPTAEESSQGVGSMHTGARFEIGGAMRSCQEFRRIILRYGPSGVAESLRLEVFAPEKFERQFSGRSRKSLDIRSQRQKHEAYPPAPIAPI